ncbi:hypothetical protein BDZ89DRAFT_611683 [Hymenopellis radicata]|nr:hypothetical protein BDZ89DRAFT_611683 [Hymenopellis radicata]
MPVSEFPWDMLKAETLRTISREIGIGYVTTREAMLANFHLVEEQGIEASIEEIKAKQQSARSTASPKRKNDSANETSRAKRPRRSDAAESVSTPRLTRTTAAASTTAGEESPRRSARKTKPTEKISAPKKKVKSKVGPGRGSAGRKKALPQSASAPNSRTSTFTGVVVARKRRAADAEDSAKEPNGVVKKAEDDEASSSVGGSNKGVCTDDGLDTGLTICNPENDLPAAVKDEACRRRR